MAGSTSTVHHVFEAQREQEAVWRDWRQNTEHLSIHAGEAMQSKLISLLDNSSCSGFKTARGKKDRYN